VTFLPGNELDSAVQEALFYRAGDDDVPMFSTNGAWADIVVRRMRALGWVYGVERREDATRMWRVRFSREGSRGEFESESRELAICAAALKAVDWKSGPTPAPGSRPAARKP
jgi:hypothetical protein